MLHTVGGDAMSSDGETICLTCGVQTLDRDHQDWCGLKVRELSPNGEGTSRGDEVRPSSWAPVDLAAVLDGRELETPPSILCRDDGVCLVTPGLVHGLNSESEAGKTWIACAEAVERFRLDEHAVYLDFETTAGSIVQRLYDLGATREQIANHFTYVRPDEPLTRYAQDSFDLVLRSRPSLVVVDGVTEAMVTLGLNLLDNSDVARFQGLVARPCAEVGAAVLLLDHVTKDRDNRGRWAIGGQHKLAGIDVAFTLEAVRRFGRGREGLVVVKIAKDRPGFLRAHEGAGGRIAEVALTSYPDGGVCVRLTAPEQRDTGEPFRPTVLMERISREVETHGPLSVRAIRGAVAGKSDTKDYALELLVNEHYVETSTGARGARHHRSVRPFRAEHDAPEVDG